MHLLIMSPRVNEYKRLTSTGRSRAPRSKSFVSVTQDISLQRRTFRTQHMLGGLARMFLVTKTLNNIIRLPITIGQNIWLLKPSRAMLRPLGQMLLRRSTKHSLRISGSFTLSSQKTTRRSITRVGVLRAILTGLSEYSGFSTEARELHRKPCFFGI